MATNLLGSPLKFSGSGSMRTYNTLALPPTTAWSHVFCVARRGGARGCHLCALVFVLLMPLMTPEKHEHFRYSAGNLAPSPSLSISLSLSACLSVSLPPSISLSHSLPQQEKRSPLWPASSSSFSLFSGAVYVVSDFRCCKPSCAAPLCVLALITSV